MSVSETVSEDLTNDKVKEPSPLPQRKPRLNRRSFYLSSGQNGFDSSKSQCDTVSSQKKTLSLNSVENSIPGNKSTKDHESSKKIILNKSSCDVNIKRTNHATDVTKSSEAQPKKKHKPITWP